MDPEWIVARAFIKQEEPADYVFVSSVDDEELNVTFNTTYGNEADSEENQFLVEVKQEMDVFIKQEDELDIHSETDDGIQSDTLSSEYVPSDSECNIKNDTDDEWTHHTAKKKKKLKEKIKKGSPSTKTDLDSANYLIIDYDTMAFNGPPYACIVCPQMIFPTEETLRAHLNSHNGKRFQCKMCKNVYNNKSAVSTHMKIHEEPQFICPICSKAFTLRKSFMRHQLVHEEKKIQCDICSALFRQKSHVAEHMKVHYKRTKRFPCEFCKNISFYEKRTLNRHIKNIHSIRNRKRHRCPTCYRSYHLLSTLREHNCGKKSTEMFCLLCDQRFHSKRVLARHRKDCYKSLLPDDFRCDKCNKKFGYLHYHRFVAHVAQNCSKTIQRQCDYCKKMFPSAMKLIEHFADAHEIRCTNDMKPCPHCDRFFSSNFNLRFHLKKHHKCRKCDHCDMTITDDKKAHRIHQRHCAQKCNNISKEEGTVTTAPSALKTFECKICGCPFITKTNLQKHKTAVHSENIDRIDHKLPIVKVFCCWTCNRSFTSQLTLEKHQLEVHVKAQIFTCPICRKTFVGETPFQEHFRNGICVRERSKWFQCVYCAKIFLRKKNLLSHVRVIHPKSPVVFECDICGQTYTRKHSLYVHMRNGDHQTSWQCEFCSAKFTRKSANTNHLTNCKSKNAQTETAIREREI